MPIEESLNWALGMVISAAKINYHPPVWANILLKIDDDLDVVGYIVFRKHWIC